VSIVERMARVSDRQLATLIGGVLLALAGWPLLFLQVPPYQDLPGHMATVCVLLNPERYPEFLSNGWLKANSLFLGLLYLAAKAVGVVDAARIVCALVLGATAFALPHFVLAFTDRRRLLVASLVMAPMVHHWFILMGMLGFALALPLGLATIVLLARQAAQPSVLRGLLLGALAALLWFAHAIVLLLVGLLAAIEALTQPNWRAKMSAAIALLTPFAPVAALLVVTVARQTGSAHGQEWGRLDAVGYQTNFSAVYALWAHAFFGLSPLSAAGLVPAVALAVMAARNARPRVPMLSLCALAALGAIYWFFPHTLPAFGYVSERVIPFLWAWALVHVPPRVAPWAARLLILGCLGWAAGLAVDLFRAEKDLFAFTAAAPEVPVGARMLTLNFEPRVSSRNTWSLLHASGMYTVLRAVSPQDVWADSPSMPIRHSAPPAFAGDPVSVRSFLGAARTPAAYCETLQRAGLRDVDCMQGWATAWTEFWNDALARYDYVLLWGAPAEVQATAPASYAPRMSRGRLTLLGRSAPASR
jgi:hypothetical protein